MSDDITPSAGDAPRTGPEHTLPLGAGGGSGDQGAAPNFPPPAPGAVPAGRPASGYGAVPVGSSSPYGTAPSSTTSALPAYASAGPASPGSSRHADRKGLPGWFWPTMCAMTLVVGLLGGMLGSVVLEQVRDARTPEGRTSGGLADVTTISKAPLPENGSIAEVAQTMLPSTVQIIAESDGGRGSTGSGFFLDAEGHVVTNNHVVADAADGGTIQIVDHNRKRHDATVVGRSPVYDLAVLYVKDLDGIQPAALGESEVLNVGETVVAIGSPLGLDATVTAGIVSALNRPVTTGSGADDQSYINAVQTDAAINPGNSGGPLVNLEGQVVGVNSAIATTGGGALGGEVGNIGVGFAIPIEQVKVTADQILKDGEAQYPVIGARVQSDENGQGALIVEVMSDQAAEKAGLRDDDVVTALNGRIVTDSPTLIVAIRSHQPGQTVTLTVERDGDEMEIDVVLEGQVG